MIDINEPVKPGSDVILNYENGEQKLGTASGYDREAKKGKLLAPAPNDNPNGNPNPPDAYGTQLDLAGQVRDSQGRFQPKK